MRYLCVNAAVPRSIIQSPTLAVNNKRQLEKTMDDNARHDGLVPTKKMKRFRSAFTTEQIQYLDVEFRKYPYIGSARRKEVAAALNITERAVKIWFQNRRMKEKKDGTPNEVEGDEHKYSRRVDAANDQLNNECTVTSTNNQHYVSLTIPLTPAKSVSPVSIKREFALDEDKTNQKVSPKKRSSAEFSIELFKRYSNYIKKPRVSQVNPSSQNAHSEGIKTPKNEVSSTSLYEKLPQDLSRKRKHPEVKTIATPMNPSGGYFPLNLKKYYAQPSMPMGSNMLWKPVQVLPVPNGQMPPMAMPPMAAPGGQDCRCDCRCHPVSVPPMLVQQGAPHALPQYFLTALPLQNSYY